MMVITQSKSAYMKLWRQRKEREDPGYAEREREKARTRSKEKYHAKKHDPDYMQAERERKRLAIAKKRSDPEIRATLNARRRELAQEPEAKRKQSQRIKKWKTENSVKVTAYHKQWREENAEHVSNYGKKYMADYVEKPEVQSKTRERSLWKNYRMTPTEFNDLWELQSGKCAICNVDLLPRGRKNHSVAIDHNHSNGLVRGLLCHACNRAIGLFKDNPDILQSAAEYLNERGHYSGKKLLIGEQNE